ncbi:nucleotidyltransferase family protein [Cellulosilyticum ruminicola]|uniref:nucleotidyltransferase family protein n=1 Tax=Cellulosilyticum ruminicola TaxID=425254 RepID=UPI0006D1DEAD|nr:nucleotidyltransferase family protein [Cellulosilyticum ruminicola]
MEAIILAGGLGTRLREAVKDVPKPMAPVNDRPFLQYILEYLGKHNIVKVVLAVGYKWEVIRDYFGNQYKDIKIEYSVEEEQLGTGGAIKQALAQCDEEDIFVINGDTYFDVNLLDMLNHHKETGAQLTIATKKMYEFDRYGTVQSDDNRIVKFEEKKFNMEGSINGGIYLLKKSLLNTIVEKKFSFEKDIMEKLVTERFFSAFESNTYFMDIGIPSDYKQFQEDMDA